MSALEEYDKAKTELDDIDEQLEVLYGQRNQLSHQCQNMLGDIIIERKLLSEHPWELVINNSRNIWLYGGDCMDDEDNVVKWTDLFKLLNATNWGDLHYQSHDLNITLDASDGELRLGFIDHAKTIETIVRLGLEVEHKRLIEAIEEQAALVELYENARKIMQSEDLL